MSEQEDIELIESYLNNELESSDRLLVENRIKSDTEFASLHNDIRILSLGIAGVARQDLRIELKKVEDHLADAEKTFTIKRRRLRVIVGIAATVLFFAIVGYFWVNQGAPYNEKLFAQYYQTYPNVVSPTVRGQNEKTEKALAFQRYDAGDYQGAAAAFEARTPKDFTVYFYLGMSYLEVKNIEKARANFEKCLASDNNFNSQSEWYISLCYLHDGELDKCRTILSKISLADNSFSAKATDILSKLEKRTQ